MAFCGKCGAQIGDQERRCPVCGAETEIEIQAQVQANDVKTNKMMAVIAYIGILVIVPLIMWKYKDSPFLKFHLNQAIVFCIGYVICPVFWAIPYIGGYLFSISYIIIAVLQIISIIGVIRGKTISFPLIKKVKLIKWREVQPNKKGSLIRSRASFFIFVKAYLYK